VPSAAQVFKMSFGFSIGDFIAVGKLISEITSSLKNIGKVKSEYQDLIRALESLEASLHQLDKLQTNGTSPHLTSIKDSALSCRRPLEQFLERIRRYEKSLGEGSQEKPMSRSLDTLRWTFHERDKIRDLQTHLEVDISNIHILLAQYGQEKLDHISSSIKKQCAVMNEVNNTVNEQTVAVQSNNSILTKIYQMLTEEFYTSLSSLVSLVGKS
jgi:hypothetical protein